MTREYSTPYVQGTGVGAEHQGQVMIESALNGTLFLVCRKNSGGEALVYKMGSSNWHLYQYVWRVEQAP